MLEWLTSLFSTWYDERRLSSVDRDLARLEREVTSKDTSISNFFHLRKSLEVDESLLRSLQIKNQQSPVRNLTKANKIATLLTKVSQLYTCLMEQKRNLGVMMKNLDEERSFLESQANEIESAYVELKVYQLENRSLPSLMALDDKLIGLINRTGSLLEKKYSIQKQITALHLSSEYQAQSKAFMEKIDKLEKVLVILKHSTQDLEGLVEEQIRTKIRNSKLEMAKLPEKATEAEQNKATGSSQANMVNFKACFEAIKAHDPKLAERAKFWIDGLLYISKASVSHESYSRMSMQDMRACREKLAGLLKDNPSLEADIRPLIQIMDGGQKSFQKAFRDRINAMSLLIKEAKVQSLFDPANDLAALTKQLVSKKDDKPVSPNQLQTLKTVSDVYWIFHLPFSLKILPDDALSMALSLLKENNIEEYCPDTPKESFVEVVKLLQQIVAVRKELRDLATGPAYSKLGSEDLKQLRQHKLDRLQALQQKNKTELRRNRAAIPVVKIGGGGPAGLMRGLVAAVAGVDWEVIEKRDRQSQTWMEEARKNILAFKDADVYEMLLYFGVYEDLLIKHQANKFGDGEWSLSLGSLEESLTASLMHLQKPNENRIIRGEIVAINTGQIPNRTKPASLWDVGTQVVVKGQGDSENISYADIVVAADGANGPTANLLGISRRDVSKQSMLFVVRIENSSTTSPVLSKPQKGRFTLNPSLIELEVPSSSYRMMSIPEPSQSELKRRQALVADTKDPVLKKTKQHELESWLHEGAQSFMKANGLKGKIILCRVFNITISKAKKAATIQGNTLGISSGDAYATADPISGSGGKTAIQSTRFFAYLLDSFFQQENTPDGRTQFNRAAAAQYNYAMNAVYSWFVQNSFKVARKSYNGGVELPSHFLQQAEEDGVLPSEIVTRLTLIFDKAQSGSLYTHEEGEIMARAHSMLQSAGKSQPWYKQLDSAMNEVMASIDARHKIIAATNPPKPATAVAATAKAVEALVHPKSITA